MSSVVQVVDLSCSYDGVVVLDRVSFSLEAGFTGLIGANGAGKTTLLSRLAARDPAVRGGGRVHWCRQQPTRDAQIDAFAWGWVDGAWAIQGRLGLDPADLERWPTLSAGERRRWQVGAALAHQPDVLLLDEPTDHLDADARQWLIDALRSYRGAALVVSHDRELVDTLCTAVLRLDRGRITHTRGGASEALAAWDRERGERVAALDRAAARVRASKAQLADARRDRDAAEATGRTAARMKDRRDHDGRSALAKGAAAFADAAHGRRVTVNRREVDRAERAHAELPRPDGLGGEIRFCAAPGARRRLIAWRGDLVAGSRVLARAVELVVERGEHVRIAGPNGAGKSTWLRAAIAACPGPVAWLPQELDDDRIRADLALLASLPPDARGRVLQAAACLGASPERLLATPCPSPGEARKLALALGLGQGAWLLGLDEPTNHLDLPAIRRLERALARYDGALVLVTHDEAFAAATTTRAVTLG